MTPPFVESHSIRSIHPSIYSSIHHPIPHLSHALLLQPPLIVQAPENGLTYLLLLRSGRASKLIEADVEPGIYLGVNGMVPAPPQTEGTGTCQKKN